MTSAMAITKVRLAIFLHSRFRFLLCSSSQFKTLLALKFTHYSNWNFEFFSLITYFRNHMTAYCAVIGTHSTVQCGLQYHSAFQSFNLIGWVRG